MNVAYDVPSFCAGSYCALAGSDVAVEPLLTLLSLATPVLLELVVPVLLPLRLLEYVGAL